MPFLSDASFRLRVLSLPASVCVCVCVCLSVCLRVNHSFVRAITRNPFTLGSPNLDQNAKDLGQGPYYYVDWMTLKYDLKVTFSGFTLLEIHNHRLTTREPSVRILFHGPDCFMVSILCICSYA